VTVALRSWPARTDETVVLRTDRGQVLPLDPARWSREASAYEEELLSSLAGPVLDVGCGPGRLIVSLGRGGTPALGIDPAVGAVQLARQRGASVLQRSVFDGLPGSGRWQSVLLFDGNIGIGGAPVALLRRCRQLMAPDSALVVELEAPGVGCHAHRARLERGGYHGPWFPWAVVGVDAIEQVAATAALRVAGMSHSPVDNRRFARLIPCAEDPARAVA
jgi:SAM-dependent methyltransferase